MIQQPPDKYSMTDQAHLRREIERLDQENLKRFRDIEVGSTGQTRLVFTDTTTGTRYKLTVAAGVLTLTAV